MGKVHRRKELIVSTTLTGNREHTITAGLRTVAPMVDKCIVIDTGITDRTLELAEQVVGKKLIVRQWPWREDFSAARNFALQAAEEAGATWAFTIDSDEVMYPKPYFSLRRALDEDDMLVLMTKSADFEYIKERVIKLNSGLYWEGYTHERLMGAKLNQFALTLNMVFGEATKDPLTMRAKCERDVRLLKAYLLKDPKDPRWYFYLGISLQNLGRHEEALTYLIRGTKLGDWEREAASCAERARDSFARLQRWDEGIEFYKQAQFVNPGLSELTLYINDLVIARDKHRAKFGRPLP